MNSLEFINNEIEYCQKKINTAKQEKLYQKTILLLNPKHKNTSLELNDFHILLNEEKINHLQQIKTELEAWEKLEQLEQENFDLRQALNTENENCVMLEKLIKELNSELEVEKWSSIGIWEENKTLKKVIEILKDKFFIDIIEREFDYKIGFQPKTPIKNGIETRFAQLNNDEANTLKEALEVDDE